MNCPTDAHRCLIRTRFTTFTLLFALVVGLVAVWDAQVEADLTDLGGESRQIVRMVRSWMERRHLSGHLLDDEISHRSLESFLESLDPRKEYFYQSDVDEFMAYRDQIDDMIKATDVGIAQVIFERFLQRVEQRTTLVDQLLDMEHDFTVDEYIVVDPDLLQYPRNEAEAYDRWRRRIKYELLRRKADDVETEEAIEKVRRRYSSLARQWEQTDDEELLQMFLSAMTTSFDPHSTYMSAKTLENFEIQMRLELDGIGAQLHFEDGYTVVRKIIPGGAADKDGRLQPGDKIVAVGQGEDGEMVDVIDMKLSDVVELIRGKRGTIVRLGVIPSGQHDQDEYDITRARIELKDSEARGDIVELNGQGDGTTLKVGVIVLPSFYMDMKGARSGLSEYKSTTRDVRRILQRFKRQGVEAVLLDLRQNGGGSLTEAINLTGLFIDRGPVVQVKGPDGRVQPYEDSEPGMAWEGPLVVLIDKFSASASEIFAGAMQDYDRGIIVGDEATHGKGTVQQLFDLGQGLFRRAVDAPNYGALKITIQQFYRANGDSTQNRGVEADIALPSLSTHLDVGESDLDHAMAFDRVQAVPYTKYELVDPNLVRSLAERSRQRQAQSEKFRKLARDIQRYLERKERKQVTLNEEKFLAERAEFNEEEKEEEQIEAFNDPDRPVVKRDYYFNEVLSITRDYVNKLDEQRVVRRD